MGKIPKESKTPPSDVITVDEMAEMLALPSWEKVDDMNADSYASGINCDDDTHEREGDPPCDKCGRTYPQRCLTCEAESCDEIARSWHDAVTAAFERIAERHGLEIAPVAGEDKRLPYRFRVVAIESWEDAAGKLIETINGVGHFYYPSVVEFARINCSTVRRAVLSHLQWMRRQPEVYGDTSAQRLYEIAWR